MRLWQSFRSVARVPWLPLLLVILVAGSASTEAQAAKGKKPLPHYFGSVTASGEWQQTSSCGGTYFNYQSKWQLEGLYGRTSLVPAGELNMSSGGAIGSIDWSVDELCNGSVRSGNCSVALDEFVLPVFLDKAKGGLNVDFQLSLTVVGCGTAQVAAYGAGFESFDRVTVGPHGFIPFKKIGRKVIRVPISGSDHGTAGLGSRAFSGLMSGTLTLTRRKPIQTLPF